MLVAAGAAEVSSKRRCTGTADRSDSAAAEAVNQPDPSMATGTDSHSMWTPSVAIDTHILDDQSFHGRIPQALFLHTPSLLPPTTAIQISTLHWAIPFNIFQACTLSSWDCTSSCDNLSGTDGSLTLHWAFPVNISSKLAHFQVGIRQLLLTTFQGLVG